MKTSALTHSAEKADCILVTANALRCKTRGRMNHTSQSRVRLEHLSEHRVNTRYNTRTQHATGLRRGHVETSARHVAEYEPRPEIYR